MIAVAAARTAEVHWRGHFESPILLAYRQTVGGVHGARVWEVRSRLADGIARVIFCIDGKTMFLLHGFIKKTQKTPKRELDLAKKRKSNLD